MLNGTDSFEIKMFHFLNKSKFMKKEKNLLSFLRQSFLGHFIKILSLVSESIFYLKWI